MFCEVLDLKKMCHWKLQGKSTVCNVILLTQCNCVIDSEAAQNLIDVSGMQKSISPHNHLERILKKHKTKI